MIESYSDLELKSTFERLTEPGWRASMSWQATAPEAV